MKKEEIIARYHNIPIGKTNLNKDIFVNEIKDEEDLTAFLYNMYGPRDESLTHDGLLFLKDYYGLDKVAELILKEKRKGIDYHFENNEDIISWLEKSSQDDYSENN
jgi:hypothetical protein